jgi:hypothetical protein
LSNIISQIIIPSIFNENDHMKTFLMRKQRARNAFKTRGIRREYAFKTRGIRREYAFKTRGIRREYRFKTFRLKRSLKRSVSNTQFKTPQYFKTNFVGKNGY